jgi:hypothetical protein
MASIAAQTSGESEDFFQASENVADPTRRSELRLVYSLLKPAIRLAERFRLPMRTMTDLVRLAYYEHLRERGLSNSEIALRLGQTERNVRSFGQRTRTEFFAAEREVGALRDVENAIAAGAVDVDAIAQHLPELDRGELDEALSHLQREGRIKRDAHGKWTASHEYVVLSSEKFHHRIDAVNHFLDTSYRAIVQRLVLDNRQDARVKTISFSAVPQLLQRFLQRLEGELRRDIADLEEQATFDGDENRRYGIAFVCTPVDEPK